VALYGSTTVSETCAHCIVTQSVTYVSKCLRILNEPEMTQILTLIRACSVKISLTKIVDNDKRDNMSNILSN